MEKNLEIDKTDLKILSLLMQDAKMPYTTIGEKIFVSGGTVHVRMNKMEQVKKEFYNHLQKIGFMVIGMDLEE